MPQHKSAAKRARQDEHKRIRNRQQRSRMRTMVKKVLQTEDGDLAQSDYRAVQAILDRLSTKNIIHRNQANNVKKRLTRHISSLAEA